MNEKKQKEAVKCLKTIPYMSIRFATTLLKDEYPRCHKNFKIC